MAGVGVYKGGLWIWVLVDGSEVLTSLHYFLFVFRGLLLFTAGFIMRSFASYVGMLLAATASLTRGAPQPVLEPRQNPNAIQNWSNDFADVDFNNLAGGAFNVTWNNGFGGNFVVGKGYRPGGDM